MPACARKEIFDPEEVGLYFCTSRCVRRAFLCEEDDYTGNNYDHRKVWMEEMLQYMAQYFGLDIVLESSEETHPVRHWNWDGGNCWSCHCRLLSDLLARLLVP